MPDAPIYACGRCGEIDIKLWRMYQTFHLALRCARCLALRSAGTEQEFDVAEIREDGTRLHPLRGNVTDAIGWWIPAVQIQEAAEAGEFLFWGYTSCTEADYQHWRDLPLHPLVVAETAEAAEAAEAADA